jgi:hypothetical protein
MDVLDTTARQQRGHGSRALGRILHDEPQHSRLARQRARARPPPEQLLGMCIRGSDEEQTAAAGSWRWMWRHVRLNLSHMPSQPLNKRLVVATVRARGVGAMQRTVRPREFAARPRYIALERTYLETRIVRRSVHLRNASHVLGESGVVSVKDFGESGMG